MKVAGSMPRSTDVRLEVLPSIVEQRADRSVQTRINARLPGSFVCHAKNTGAPKLTGGLTTIRPLNGGFALSMQSRRHVRHREFLQHINGLDRLIGEESSLCHRVILLFRRCIRYARAQRGVTDTA